MPFFKDYKMIAALTVFYFSMRVFLVCSVNWILCVPVGWRHV